MNPKQKIFLKTLNFNEKHTKQKLLSALLYPSIIYSFLHHKFTLTYFLLYLLIQRIHFQTYCAEVLVKIVMTMVQRAETTSFQSAGPIKEKNKKYIQCIQLKYMCDKIDKVNALKALTGNSYRDFKKLYIGSIYR